MCKAREEVELEPVSFSLFSLDIHKTDLCFKKKTDLILTAPQNERLN